MPRLAILLILLLMTPRASARAAEVTAKQTARGVTIEVDGKPFTEYLIKSGSKPVLWPLIGPTGKAMTRAYPMKEAAGEEKDHVHHRSVWFTHGKVNGVDFWLEGPEGGLTVHRSFTKIESGPQATIVSLNDWVDPHGRKICEDERRLTFHANDRQRMIDFDVTVAASDGELTFGETKEGTFGVRVAETMKVNAKRGGKIVNSAGQTDEAAWGKPAAWVDYHGPVDGQTVGIAILNHPASFRYPTHWHVRTYGLFAANPFGLKDFEQPGEGQHVIPAGGSMTLRHRMVLHAGDEQQAGIAELFAEYAASK